MHVDCPGKVEFWSLEEEQSKHLHWQQTSTLEDLFAHINCDWASANQDLVAGLRSTA